MPAPKCQFGGSEYDVGRTWHPRLESQGTVFCVSCHCHEGGRMNCTSRQCPVSCVGEETAECCRICAESRLPNKASITDVVACVHNGNIYKDGQRFPSNSTGMKVNGPNQCIQCKCQEGLVLCEIQTCSELHCTEPIHTPDNCCPHCPGVAATGHTEHPSAVSFNDPTAPRERRDRDCISAGKYYLDGSTWHPVIGPFGPMDCVMCQCNSGSIECHRFKCPSRSELPCAKPIKQFGQCCPVCPQPVMSVIPSSSVMEMGPLQCVPQNTELVVYRAQGAGNLSEFIQYAFQEPGKSPGEVQLHSWVMRKGAVETFQIQKITSEDFTQLRHKFRFSLLGISGNKHLSKFTRRERKLKKRCLETCSTKVQRLEDSLNLIRVEHRKTCLSSEIQLTSV
ncbi:chordin-like protein 1 [Anabrus simplex]|uniref:chordin-like protein 1 n=1 Tax=Anabrus simplex TaxID=316456 RepID=UPI0035A29D81